MVMHGTHPDIINVQANANGNYIVDDSIRPIVADSAVMPNESRYKVYIIPDLDRSVNTAVAVQNIIDLTRADGVPDSLSVSGLYGRHFYQLTLFGLLFEWRK